MRGERRNERPPQLGPNAPWWDDFKPFADACRRICWINATSRHLCDIAILSGDRCGWRASKSLFEQQRDFNYVEARLLLDGTARATASGIEVADMIYRVLIVEDEALLTPAVCEALEALRDAGRVVSLGEQMLPVVSRLSEVELILDNAHTGVRVRRVKMRNGGEYAIIFNEAGGTTEGMTLKPEFAERAERIDPATGEPMGRPLNSELRLERWELALLRL